MNENRRLPVIYVRGFAGKPSGIDRAIDDPLYGFNEGSVHVRVDGHAQPRFYQFEGPLLRLIRDKKYELHVYGNQRGHLESQKDGTVQPATVWVHRFYDQAASSLRGEPVEFRLEQAAEDLFELVKLVRQKTGAPRVFLVAHSMGGLICRSMIQRVIPENKKGSDKPIDYVDRLFTYGTPHGGIEFSIGFGLLEKLRDTFDLGDAAIFGPKRMYQYLTPHLPEGAEPPAGWDPAVIPDGVFPPERVFCLVGTNPQDYEVALGLSSKAAGVRSDGLVQINNAFVPGANRAFVHRSHSGRYGLVNSEEGYQSLWRFLFGDLRVDVELVGLNLPGTRGDDTSWQLDVQLAIRGLPILVHEQIAAHHCPIQIEWPEVGDLADRPWPLITTFLSADVEERPPGADSLRYALHVRLISMIERTGLLDFTSHLEQTPDFDDTLIVDLKPSNGVLSASAAWNSEIPGAIRDFQPDLNSLNDGNQADDLWQTDVLLPAVQREVFGEAASIRLTIRPWA